MSERTLVCKGGRLVDETGVRSGDVLIAAGRIVAVGPDLQGDDMLDATGCVVSPGLVDLHTHVDSVQASGTENLRTVSAAAARGGYTCIQVMPTTDLVLDNAAAAGQFATAATASPVEVGAVGAITVGNDGELLAAMGELAALGIRRFGDGGRPVGDAGLLRRAMEYAGAFGATLLLSPEDPSLTGDAVMHEGEWSNRLGMAGQPAEAEELGVMRALALARLTGCAVHFQRVSTAASVAMLGAARAGGLPVSAEVTPHHLVFVDADCATYDPALRVWPPLRSAADRDALRRGVGDGSVDAIATDHRSVLDEDKEQPFDVATPGAIGLEVALAAALTHLDLPIERVLAALSWRPARIAGVADRHGGPIVEDAPANLCIFDPDETWTVDPTALHSVGRNTPFAGRTLRGRVRHTICDGVAVVANGVPTR